jgi:16S rRNA (cytosine967-C5)-methyltransferase
VAAAIEVLDAVQDGMAAEQALTRWARQSRFAGSKDRAAVRDHVFDALRLWRSTAAYGGGETGRARMIGLLRQQGEPVDALFDGSGHAPAPLDASEMAAGAPPEEKAGRWNLPDWLIPEFDRSLGKEAEQAAMALQARAPVSLRVNTAKTTVPKAMAALRDEGVETLENPLAKTALTVGDGARRLKRSHAYANGLVELQDASSQAVVAGVPEGVRCLDYCAGGGGKALALAAQPGRSVHAHDLDPRRMVDLPARAARAGVTIPTLTGAEVAGAAPFDLVLCDVPCSGSGAWRRSPEAKWRLTREGLDVLTATQDSVLQEAVGYVRPKGWLVYATCSVLRCENHDRIDAFLASHPDWRCAHQWQFSISEAGDGFFTAHLTRV